MINLDTELAKIKNLVQQPGYIYALIMIIMDDFYVRLEDLHNIDQHGTVNTKEIALLLGFIVQNKINFEIPNNFEEILSLKTKTRELLHELHISLWKQTKFNERFEKYSLKEIFVTGATLVESIFYSGSGAYDFQYLDFLERRYELDADWLKEKKFFDLTEITNIISHIKEFMYKKLRITNLGSIDDIIDSLAKKYKEDYTEKNWQSDISIMRPLIELRRYAPLQFNNKGEVCIEHFCRSLINIVTINELEIEDEKILTFIKQFSQTPSLENNIQFKKIGDYNLINSCPIIEIKEKCYYIAVFFLLYEAVYETPYYWMGKDTIYFPTASKNRGRVSENIIFDLLVPVFGQKNTFKDITIYKTKSQMVTDIDILCILGNKALCVQVKSQKLTLLSRTGNQEQLFKDFKYAVQDAYIQGQKARNSILKRNQEHFKVNELEINIPTEIDEVFLLIVTTENYPALTTQAYFLLDKGPDAPYPLVTTLFDLEILLFYLKDPYDFLYYIKQRVNLRDYFFSDSEISLLAFHLLHKLYKDPAYDKIVLDSELGQVIDRNYYPYRMGFPVSDEGDALKLRWKNDKFIELCNLIKSSYPKQSTPDIIFSLYNWSGNAIDGLIKSIERSKNQTCLDGKFHDFTLLSDKKCNYGISYISANYDDKQQLFEDLTLYCQLRKYKSKSNEWVGFASLKNSQHIIDLAIYNNQIWSYDADLENGQQLINNGRLERRGRKIGRNELCSCGSQLKFKKCCGR